MEHSKTEIINVLTEYIHNREARKIMVLYLTDRPRSLEVLAEECEVSVSTVKRTIDRCSFVYKYLP